MKRYPSTPIITLVLSFILIAVDDWSLVRADERPNILVIVADDLGYHDVGFHGLEDFTTPNLDALARDGVICRNGYASHPFCAPTRAGLLTGRYQHRFGFEGNPIKGSTTQGLPASESTLADALVSAGYATVGIGKWHLGEGDEHHPVRRGFQSYFGFLEGSRSYFKTNCQWLSLRDDNTIAAHGPSKSSRQDYLTDLLTDEAIEFISKPREQPFFMYLAYNAPHAPMQATKTWMDRVPEIANDHRRTYAAMVTAMDDGIGRIRQAIAASGDAENTLVFFFSDNGGITPVNSADNTPLSGLKGTLLEGGIRVPFVVSWPKSLPKGTEYPHSVMTFDVFQTACIAAGIDNASVDLDSVDLVPFLAGIHDREPHPILFWRTGSGFQLAARQGNYKFLHIEAVEDRVFDLTQDVAEKNPLPNAEHSQADELATAAKRWSASLPKPSFTGHGLILEEQWRSVGLTEPPSSDLRP